ncbi:MAG: hypothetical protein PHH13_02735 [Candidatus Peribacteraceae bacterium]|nr:hypothetical protein [Candidatus Peribacteraceae bacterium]
MFTYIRQLFSHKNTRIFVLGLASIVSCFAVGIRSAGEVQPITLIEAGSADLTGDINDDGAVDLQDIRIILEIAQGYREATPEELRADPDQNGAFTVDDALRLLAALPTR